MASRAAPSLFGEAPEPITRATHCVVETCQRRLGQLEGRWSSKLHGWMCEDCRWHEIDAAIVPQRPHRALP